MDAADKRVKHYLDKLKDLLSKADSEGIVLGIVPSADKSPPTPDLPTVCTTRTLYDSHLFDHLSNYRDMEVEVFATIRVLSEVAPPRPDMMSSMANYAVRNARIYINEITPAVPIEDVRATSLTIEIATGIRDLLFQARRTGVEVVINNPLKVELVHGDESRDIPLTSYRFNRAMCPVPQVADHPDTLQNCAVIARRTIIVKVVDGAEKEFAFIGKGIPLMPVD